MNLDIFRREIDEVDSKILNLLFLRLEIVQKIARLKLREKIPVSDKKRESEILNRVKSYSKKVLIDPDEVLKIFKLIIALSKKKEKEIYEKFS